MSHPYKTGILPGNILRWKFGNIQLPDSNSNEPGSQGYIQYRIPQKANNALGTEIKNTAYIYFDFNDPVATNTMLNTIWAPTVGENEQASHMSVAMSVVVKAGHEIAGK